MKKLTFLLISIMALVAVSCSDEDISSYPPTYQGFRVVPANPHPGDSVFITAVQQVKGNYLNATSYSWAMDIMVVKADGSTEKEELYTVKDTNYGGLDNSDPVWRIYLPSNTQPGTYTCKFTARWSNSADGMGGTFFGGTGEGCVGSITANSYTLYSNASGSFRLTVTEKP